MQKYKLVVLSILLSAVHLTLSAQNNTNSPYTRFGYGDITESTATELKGMGGVSLANRSHNTINSVNPASYSSVDSLTFMFDMAAGTRYSHFSDNQNSHTTFNANLEYLSMRFPLTKWMAVSAGMQPFSLIGYNFNQSDSLVISSESDKKIGYNQTFNGSGGFSQVYGGISMKFFDHIAVGANAYYIFGESLNISALSFGGLAGYNNSVFTNQIKANDYKFRYGLQAYNTFAKKHDVTLGLIYEHKSKLNGSYTSMLNADTIRHLGGFELPQTMGAGLSYKYNNSLTVAADYTMQNWGDALYFGKTDSLVNTRKLAVGMEYTRNPNSWRRYSDLIRYRAGFSTGNQYYRVGSQSPMNNFTFSLGAGFPTRTGKSMMNFALEYGRIGSTSMLREQYVKLTFGASINEYWFFKPKL